MFEKYIFLSLKQWQKKSPYVRMNAMKHRLTALILIFITLIMNAKENFVEHVNPKIGGISHLLVPTFPNVQLPNSFVRFYPIRYGLANVKIESFPLTVASHRGGGVFKFAPLSKDLKTALLNYSFDCEKSAPNFYEVFLDEHNASLSFSPSVMGGIFNLKFGEDAEVNKAAINTRNGEIEIAPSGAICASETYTFIKGSAVKIYLYAEFDKEPKQIEILKDSEGQSAFFTFEKFDSDLNFKYSLSLISSEQAKANFTAQIHGKNLEDLKIAAAKIWNKTLGKIGVSGGDAIAIEMFYTSLYRAYERMVNISEDGRYYSAYDGKIHESRGFDFYVDDWAWDTFRCQHPLMTILSPKAQRDKIISYVKMAEQSGSMPTFPTLNGDAHCMNGSHYASIIWDAYSKGIDDFDLKSAFESSKKTVLENTLIPWIKAPKTSLDDFYNKEGYFPALNEGEIESEKLVNGFERRQAVSVTLAQSYDDWCLAQISRALKLGKDAEFFLSRSKNYRNLWNAETQFFQPKDKEGNWIKNFDPRFSGGCGSRAYFAENNAWIYIWDVMHDFSGLIELFGSDEAFEKKLDALFEEPLGTSRPDWAIKMPDATGMLGQFPMGNEPALHVPYLYNYVGKPWKTQKLVRTLLDLWFRADYMGIPGDEDGGAMSSFYVFSALGFYPVSPGIPIYAISSPLFERAKINLESGRTFEIVCKNYAPENKYIHSAKLNGRPLNRSWISHSEILEGGILEFEMSKRANKNWAVSPESRPQNYESKHSQGK